MALRAAFVLMMVAGLLMLSRTPSRVAAAGGVITTVAGGGNGDGPATRASFLGPADAAVDVAGSVYITDIVACNVREVAGGIVTTIAGNGVCGYSGDGGPATAAELKHPTGVAVDSTGDVYIADESNCVVREVLHSTGTITTVAGSTCGDAGIGGPATSAKLGFLTGVALDATGNLYVADYSGCAIYEVTGGIINAIVGDGYCGYGGDGGPAVSASINPPAGLAVDGSGNLYVADLIDCRVRKVTGGIITTVAGNGACDYSGDGGPATSAGLDDPGSMALDGAGNLYIASTLDCRVREVSGTTIATVAGNGTCTFSGDGGPATAAAFNVPSGVAVDGASDLFIVDELDCRVREVTDGTIDTFAGYACGYSGDGGPATSAVLHHPTSVALDGAGDLYLADTDNCRVREVVGGTISTVAGSGIPPYHVSQCGNGGDGGLATSATLAPFGVAADAGGNLYISDAVSCEVREVAGGIITTVAGIGTCGYGGDGGPATSASLDAPNGIAVARNGDLYIADTNNCLVRKVSGGIITTVAGTWCGYGGDGGPATSAALDYPQSVTLDGAGNLFIADTGNCRVREVSQGVITTVASLCAAGIAVDRTHDIYATLTGGWCNVDEVVAGIDVIVAGNGVCSYGGDGGLATSASLYLPAGLAIDSTGDVYIVDQSNNRVRVVGCSTTSDQDCDSDTDFFNPGSGQSCVQDHVGDTNNDGYSDSDEGTVSGTPGCTGAYPPTGGLGMNPAASCPGRNLLGTLMQVAAARAARADVDVNGRVNILDLSAAASAYNQSGFTSNPYDYRNEFDQNGDGVINILDLAAMAGQYNKTVPPC